MPPELLDLILGYLGCDTGETRRGPGGGEVHVAMEALQWNSWAGERRASIGDWSLPSILAFGLCSRACRLAATRDAVWRKRAEVLERTYRFGSAQANDSVPIPKKNWYCSDSEDEAERAALPAPVPLPKEYVDPRQLDSTFAAKSPFQRYLSLAKFRNRVRTKLEALCDDKDSWSTADRGELLGLVDMAKSTIEFAVEEGYHDEAQSVEECLQKCTVTNAAEQVVKFVIRELDRGVSDHGGLRNNAGRLIVYGFAHGIYPGFPGSREFEWEYALSGLESINPDNF